MATDPQSLMDGAVCQLCRLPAGTLLAILVNLYAQIAGVSTDPQTLMDNARCIECNIPPGALLAILVSLVANQSTSGGGAAITGTTANPNGNITGTVGQLYVDTNLQTLWVQENAAGGNTGWVQFV